MDSPGVENDIEYSVTIRESYALVPPSTETDSFTVSFRLILDESKVVFISILPALVFGDNT